uniref:Uncharacterized protein n=1 Tax=Tanacetum cinerariifolium TaxID=118510 RepID=A0A699K3E6_TANCI|nr:hypothetical protein [Tanacetum cinerariifolium]
MSGAKTHVHTPTPGESKAKNGLPDSILSSEPKSFVQHRPHPLQFVWSPGGLSCGGMCRGGGNGGDGNAAGVVHLARRSPTEGGDSKVSGDCDGVGMAKSLSTSASSGKDMAA